MPFLGLIIVLFSSVTEKLQRFGGKELSEPERSLETSS